MGHRWQTGGVVTLNNISPWYKVVSFLSDAGTELSHLLDVDMNAPSITINFSAPCNLAALVAAEEMGKPI